MIKEIRKLQDKRLAKYIRMLQHRGSLVQYLSARGYAAFDTEEYRTYKKNVRIGRPLGTKNKEAQGE